MSVKKRFTDMSKEERKEYHREYYHAKRKSARILKTYNLTEKQCNDIWKYQGGRCAICQTDINKPGDRENPPHIDHCHTTGKVRGLLCPHCNLMLGHSKDNKDTLLRAIRYLEIHSENA